MASKLWFKFAQLIFCCVINHYTKYKMFQIGVRFVPGPKGTKKKNFLNKFIFFPKEKHIGNVAQHVSKIIKIKFNDIHSSLFVRGLLILWNIVCSLYFIYVLCLPLPLSAWFKTSFYQIKLLLLLFRCSDQKVKTKRKKKQKITIN